MDKISRALLGVEDNAVRISALEKKIAQKPSFLYLTGVYDGTNTVFGEVKAENCLAIITFSGTDAASLRVNKKSMGSGTSPFVTVVNGNGELRLVGNKTSAKAFLIGKITLQQQ